MSEQMSDQIQNEVPKSDTTVVMPIVRKLTEEEHKTYSGACIRAIAILPAFRDAVALLSPFFDSTASTAYTDRFARVGLSSWFFEELSSYQRASVVLHEAMHVLNNHFARGDLIAGEHRSAIQNKVWNIAGDFEINCGLEQLPQVDLKFAVFPDRGEFTFPPHKSMEQYIPMLNEVIEEMMCSECGSKKDDPSESDGDSQDSGDGSDNNNDSGDEQGSQNGSDSAGSDSDESGDQDGQGSDSGSSENGDSGDEQGNQDGSSSGSGSDESGDQDGQGSDSGSSENGDSGDDQGNQDGQGSGSDSGDKCSSCGKDKQGGSQGQGQPGQGQPGQGNHCDTPTPERSAAADDADVERASSAAQSVAQRNTIVRMQEEMKRIKGVPGSNHMENFLSTAMLKMNPPKVPWQSIFKRAIANANSAVSRGRADFSYRRVNRRFTNSQYIFPGMVKYTPKTMAGIDTSGSMGGEDYQVVLSEIAGIIKSGSREKDAFSFFSVDTKVDKTAPVRRIEDIKLYGGGGTDMAVALEYLATLSAREFPNIFVLATDGYTSWESYERAFDKIKRPFAHIILVSEAGGYLTVPESMRRKAVVIDISSPSQ